MKRDTLIKLYKKHQTEIYPALSAHAQSGIKARVLRNLHTPITPVQTSRSWTFFYTRYAVVTAGILALLTGTAYASSSAIPGDALYPVKRAVENTRVVLATNAETKTKLQIKFTEERLNELEKAEAQAPVKQKIQLSIRPDTTPIDTPPTTLNAEPEVEREETPAENSAQEEVHQALKKLEKTREDLNNQGKQVIADDLAKTINILNGRARKSERKHKEPQEDRDTHRDSDEPTGATHKAQKELRQNPNTHKDSRD